MIKITKVVGGVLMLDYLTEAVSIPSIKVMLELAVAIATMDLLVTFGTKDPRFKSSHWQIL